MISFEHRGNFEKTTKYLEKIKRAVAFGILDKYGRQGVEALQAATPVDTGKTAQSWYYTIERKGNTASINFHNSNIQNGVPIAVIIQYGHGTRNGGWVEGRDYINPAIRPIFDGIATTVWREVTRL